MAYDQKIDKDVKEVLKDVKSKRDKAKTPEEKKYYRSISKNLDKTLKTIKKIR